MKDVNRKFWQRILGIPATGLPADPDCWTYAGGKINVDLSRAPELAAPGGGLRLEGNGLPVRVLVVRGADGTFHAVKNRCTHLGHRRLDPCPSGDGLQCCSVNKSAFDLSGKRVSGPARKPVAAYPVTEKDGRLIVEIA
ncbi:MAG: Rieske 2Fe-2S domain-containing protein [Proteobacteria bacterium]|nr:Rieske 2Fe-2S domain-containing protein [Pseudomonadota bacterium]